MVFRLFKCDIQVLLNFGDRLEVIGRLESLHILESVSKQGGQI